jgi:hypothetical protein
MRKELLEFSELIDQKVEIFDTPNLSLLAFIIKLFK